MEQQHCHPIDIHVSTAESPPDDEVHTDDFDDHDFLMPSGFKKKKLISKIN